MKILARSKPWYHGSPTTEAWAKKQDMIYTIKDIALVAVTALMVGFACGVLAAWEHSIAERMHVEYVKG